MLTHPTSERLTALGLAGMARALDELDLHRFRSGQVLILGGPLFEGHG